MAKITLAVKGDFVTETARKMFFEDRVTYKEAETYLSAFLGGQPEHVQKSTAKQILEGDKKLVGINVFDLVDDNCHRTISDDDILDREQEAIMAIKQDMESHAEKYVDFYAMDKSWRFFVGHTPRQVWEYAYTDMDTIARHVRGTELVTIECQPILTKPLELSHCYDDSERAVLDHGAYLVNDYMLVYQLIGEPLSASNQEYFYKQLYEYWEKSPLRRNPAVMRRQSRYRKAKDFHPAITLPTSKAEADRREKELQKVFSPLYDDTFTSTMGIIDPDGHWYSCEWAEHGLKAKTILTAKCQASKNDSLDACLDKALELGYVFIRDPERTGNASVYGLPNDVQKQTIESYCNYYGIEEYLY